MQHENPPGPRSGCAIPVRLLRVKKGQRKLLLALSREILGFVGHWDGKAFQSCRARQGRCKLCPGPEGWRGYFAALVWEENNARWEPCGVEVSDRDELVMRPQYRAGTRWSFFRPWPVRQVNQRLQILLRGAHELPELPPPFVFLALVRQLYQDPELLLDVPNPLPPEMLAQYAQPPAPDDHQPEAAAPTDGALPSLLDEHNRRFGAGSGRNGKGEVGK